jgi:DNA replication protein DnaC
MTNSKIQLLPEGAENARWIRPTATFESFCWEESPSLDRDLFLKLATCDFIAEGQNVIFCGPTTSGKTHLSNALADIALRAGYSVNLIDSTRLNARFSWQSCLERYVVECDLLLIDDPQSSEQLQAILKERQGRSTLLLSYLPAAELLSALMPAEVNLQPLRDSWKKPIVIEFKENLHGTKLRGLR